MKNINGRPRKDRTGNEPGTRICNSCKQSLAVSLFSKDSSRYDNLSVCCRQCINNARKEWAKRNPERDRERSRKWIKAHPKEVLERNKKWRFKRRVELINHYGGKCACCGETHIEFLSIDHIGGGGTKHRAELKRRGGSFHTWLFANNFPEGFRVLCHNCNQAIGFYGYCPHQSESIQKQE